MSIGQMLEAVATLQDAVIEVIDMITAEKFDEAQQALRSLLSPGDAEKMLLQHTLRAQLDYLQRQKENATKELAAQRAAIAKNYRIGELARKAGIDVPFDLDEIPF